jgi:uncharacterized membrane protein
MAGASSWTDEVISDWIGHLLRVGVVLSAAVILVGGLLYLYHHGLDKLPAAKRRTFVKMPPEFSKPSAIARAALLGQRSENSPEGPAVAPDQGRGGALIQLGLLLLIATPVVRVAFSILAFARQRDVVYVFFTLLVLGVLIYSLFSGQIH